MKKVLFVIGFSLAIFASQSQPIDTTSVWRINHQVWEPGVNMHFTNFIDYIQGETTINGLQYFKIFRSGYYYQIPDPTQTYYYFNDFHGYLREANNKWYTLLGNQDTLLYDFTLQVGDTVKSAFTYTDGELILINAIDSVMVGTVYKKRFHLNFQTGGGTEYIIEGIGATSGLFENMYFFEWFSDLLCFAVNGQSVWGLPTADCELNVGLNDAQSIVQNCSVYPNPAEDKITVTFPGKFRGASLSILDPIGRVVFHQVDIMTEQVTIPVTTFSSGIYLVRIENARWNQSMKVIINH